MIKLWNFLYAYFPNVIEYIGTIGAVLVIVGLLDAFFGYKLFKIVLAIIGFLVGAEVGFVVFLQAGGGAVGSDAMIGYIVIGGLIGSFIAEFFHKVGVFLVVGAMGMIVAFLTTQDAQSSLVIGIICGVAGVFLEKYVIIVTTSLSGGLLTATGFWFIAFSNGQNTDTKVIGWVIGIAGICFQLWLEKKKPKETDGAATENRSEFINDIKSKLESVDPDVVKSISVKALIGLPIIVGILLGSLFGSFLFGFGVIAVLYVLVMLQHVRKRKADVSPGEFAEKYTWEKWVNRVLDENIFLLFVPLIPGFFIWALLGTYINGVIGFIFALLGTVGIYILYFKALPGDTPKESSPSPMSVKNNQTELQSGTATKETDGAATESRSEFINDIKSRLENIDPEDVKSITVKALLGLPIIVGIILGSLFGSFLFGFGVIAVLYVLVLLQHVRKRKADISSGDFVQRYAWEKWVNIVLDNNVFIVFVPLIPGCFIWALLGTFMHGALSFILALLGTVGIYILYFKALPDMPKESSPSPVFVKNNQTEPQSGTATVEASQRCPNCGFALTEDSVFCSGCGVSVQVIEAAPEFVFCIKCGTKLPSDAAFCDDCGAVQQTHSAPTPTPIPVAPTSAAMVATVKVESTSSEAKRKSKKLAFGIIGIAVVVVIAIVALSGGNNKYVKLVKNGTLNDYQQMTIGEAHDRFLSNAKWESGVSEEGQRFVNVRGNAMYLDKNVEIVVQYFIDEKNGTIEYNAMEINGVPQSNFIYWAFLEKMYE